MHHPPVFLNACIEDCIFSPIDTITYKTDRVNGVVDALLYDNHNIHTTKLYTFIGDRLCKFNWGGGGSTKRKMSNVQKDLLITTCNCKKLQRSSLHAFGEKRFYSYNIVFFPWD